MEKNKYSVRRRFAVIPAIIILFMFLPGMSVLSWAALLHPLLSVLWMLAAGAAYIGVLNRIETRRHQHIFIILSCIAFPFVAYGVLIGGLLGAYGIILGSGIPLAILLIFGGGVLYKTQHMQQRFIVLGIAFLILIMGAAWLISYALKGADQTSCVTLRFGEWDEQQRQCIVEPDQQIRNAIFFSTLDLHHEDSRVFPSIRQGADVSYDMPGDIILGLYQSGAEIGSVTVQTNHAVRKDNLILVPLISSVTESLYLASLRV